LSAEAVNPSAPSEGPEAAIQLAGGRSLGTFRNTYYDFPSEAEFGGPTTALKNATCDTIAQVPRAFFESLCVQGSGTLKAGATVSFARRNCECAEVCPRTNEKICFDKLDQRAFPWGRGATGKAITPLISVAVDSDVVPLGTALYVPELDGLPRDLLQSSVHDGCFLAEDRGIRVKGKHIDVFTGHSSTTLLWNKLVPSNRGVTVVLDSPRCARAK
jgi:3D (Asp-Asp-Asp) domain-containing protein